MTPQDQPPAAPAIAASAMVAELRALVAEERSVNDSLRTRATALAGFTGLTATFAGTVLRASVEAPLAVRIVAFALVVLALLALVTGVVLLVAVIAPRQGARATIPLEAVRAWPENAGMPADHFYVLEADALVPVLAQARETGTRLSKALLRARIPVIVGLGLMAAESMLVAFFATGLD